MNSTTAIGFGHLNPHQKRLFTPSVSYLDGTKPPMITTAPGSHPSTRKPKSSFGKHESGFTKFVAQYEVPTGMSSTQLTSYDNIGGYQSRNKLCKSQSHMRINNKNRDYLNYTPQLPFSSVRKGKQDKQGREKIMIIEQSGGDYPINVQPSAIRSGT